MIQELANSFKAILYDRIVSPLSGAFICSWVVINWKIPLIIFGSNTSVFEKIEYIEKYFLNSKNLIYYPLASTLFIVIIYPWLSNAAYYIWQLSNSFKIKTRLKLENNSPLTLKQSIDLRKEIQRKDLEFNELLQGRNDTINKLEDHNKYLNEMLNKKESELFDVINNKSNNSINKTKQDDKVNFADWDLDFTERINNQKYIINEFDEVIDATLGRRERPLDADTLRYFTSAGILDYDPQSKMLKLSDKGRYFANLWTKRKE